MSKFWKSFFWCLGFSSRLSNWLSSYLTLWSKQKYTSKTVLLIIQHTLALFIKFTTMAKVNWWFRAGDTWGAGGPWSPTFLRSKKKKGRQSEKRKGFKTESIKRLSPRSKYYCFNLCRASRIRTFSLSANHGGRQYFSVFHVPPTLKSISPALWFVRLFTTSSTHPPERK